MVLEYKATSREKAWSSVFLKCQVEGWDAGHCHCHLTGSVLGMWASPGSHSRYDWPQTIHFPISLDVFYTQWVTQQPRYILVIDDGVTTSLKKEPSVFINDVRARILSYSKQSVLVIFMLILVIIIIPQRVTLVDVSRLQGNSGYKKYTLAFLDIPLLRVGR